MKSTQRPPQVFMRSKHCARSRLCRQIIERQIAAREGPARIPRHEPTLVVSKHDNQSDILYQHKCASSGQTQTRPLPLLRVASTMESLGCQMLLPSNKAMPTFPPPPLFHNTNKMLMHNPLSHHPLDPP